MARQVPTEAPWQAAQAEAWDSQTFETWMRTNLVPPDQPVDGPTNSLLNLAIESVFAAEPRDLSLLHVLFYAAAAGTLDNLVDTAGGAQDSRFVGGSQRISLELARQLGRRVHLRSPVRRLVQSGRSVTAVCDGGFEAVARRAIVAIPPTLAGRIVCEPALASVNGDGGLRDQLTQRVPMGTTIKVQCLYDRPFWRASGLAGQATSDTGPVKITFDNTPYPDSGAADVSPGVLIGFIEGADGRAWGQRSRADRFAAVVDCFARYFGAQARNVRGGIDGYVEMLWAREEFTGGCYGGIFPTGVWTSYGAALRSPVGLVHWAGTETATVWNGYMDGAVRSGQRVAKEVARLLR
jgi:monoamine oxidase